MTPDGIAHIGGKNAVAIPPVPVSGSYELEVRMFPRGGHLAITFPVGDSEATLLPNLSQPNPFVAIENIRSMGARHEDNPTHSASSPVKNGVETSLLLRVTEQTSGDWSIEVFHEDILLTSWTGPPSDLDTHIVWKLPESNRIGLGSFESKGGATYLSAILTPLLSE